MDWGSSDSPPLSLLTFGQEICSLIIKPYFYTCMRFSSIVLFFVGVKMPRLFGKSDHKSMFVFACKGEGGRQIDGKMLDKAFCL